jgi:hypothetical protein
MAITLGGQAATWAASGTSVQAVLNGVQAGDLLVACLAFRVNGTASGISCSDDVNGAWTLAKAIESAQGAIYYFANSQAGNVTVTASWTGATVSYINIQRYAGAKTSAVLDQTNAATNTTTTTHSHGSITTTAAAVLVTCSAQSAILTETPNADFTALTNTAGRDYFQYRIASGAVTTDGAYTSAETATSRGAIASFLEAAAGGTAIPVFMAQYRQRWGG